MNKEFKRDYLPLYIAELCTYVGRTYWIDYNEVYVVGLYGGIAGPPFFLCKWDWSNEVFCADPLDVLSFFDDNKNPVKPDGIL